MAIVLCCLMAPASFAFVAARPVWASLATVPAVIVTDAVAVHRG